MKRKIIFILLAVSLVFTMSVTAFASGGFLPSIPDVEYPYITVAEVGGVIRLYATNTPCERWGQYTQVAVEEGDLYKLVDGKWVFSHSFSFAQMQEYELIFDSSGTFASNDSSIFLVGFNDFKDIHKGLTNQLNVVTVVNVLVFGAFIVGGFVFMWWGVRKIVRVFMTAFRKGKISL